jgi:DNA repair exonuclease SbcCD ATPase subunit
MKPKLPASSILAMICLLLLHACPVFAQETIEVKVEKAGMSKGMQTAYIVEVPMAALKDVQQNWIKRLQQNIKTKVVQVKDEYVLSNAVIAEITTDTISVYSLFIGKEGRVLMNVFIETDSVFFSPQEDKTQLSAEKTDNAIKNYVRNFAVEQYRLAAGNALKAEQKILEGLENDLKKLIKDNENMVKEISSLENNIEKKEREIKNLDQEIDLKNQGLLSHKSSMALLAVEAEKKAAQDKEKELDKEVKKLEKERVNAKNDISGMKADIEKNNKEITNNEKLQEEKQGEINVQKEDVKNAQALLDGIK